VYGKISISKSDNMLICQYRDTCRNCG
jgi:hypothetical protein